MTGAHYVSSFVESYVIKVMNFLAQSARGNITSFPDGAHSSQIFSVDFAITRSFEIKLLSVTSADLKAEIYSSHAKLAKIREGMLKDRASLVVELARAPTLFTRMRRGDAYGGFRVVFSEMEEQRYPASYDPCAEFASRFAAGKLFVSPSQVAKASKLGNFINKRHTSNKRELKKYVDKKWAGCKYKEARYAARVPRRDAQDEIRAVLPQGAH